MRNYLFIIVLSVSACVNPHEFEVIDTRRVLVIDAQVANVPGEQFVQLQYSYALDGIEPEALTGATIVLRDDLGNTINFLGDGSGLYQPDASFVGIVGRKYQLSIGTPDGKQYQSREEELLSPVQEVDIYGRFLTLRSETSGGFDVGIQFLTDIAGVSGANHNYRFEYVEDHEILVPFASLYEYNVVTGEIDRRLIDLERCYINKPSESLLIATTGGQVNSDLLEFPIEFIKTDEPDLLGRYSLRLKAFRISGAAYQYYKDLQENNESAGSFFDRQKGQLIGNIQNVNDITEPVLGYFEVAGVTETFEVFEGGAWRDEGFAVDKILDFCDELTETVPTVDILAGDFDFSNRLIYDFAPTDNFVPGTFYNTAIILAPKICSDCRTYGSLERPSFWD
ncbi:MAG: DUF4249 domain-containing protein [Cytophagales bacterium]|nr:DUF4249 domain-containing protein [Cytophagales bacterium]